MTITMPDVAATRRAMLDAYREGLDALLVESARTVHELATEAESNVYEDLADDPFGKLVVLTRKDVDDAMRAIFTQPIPMPDETAAEVHTPATIYVSAICPRCGLAQRILATISSELLVSDDGSELRIKAKSKGVSHICGQLPLPETSEADGQQELPLEPLLLEAGDVEEDEPELVGAEA